MASQNYYPNVDVYFVILSRALTPTVSPSAQTSFYIRWAREGRNYFLLSYFLPGIIREAAKLKKYFLNGSVLERGGGKGPLRKKYFFLKFTNTIKLERGMGVRP